jgi:hypothetical protein
MCVQPAVFPSMANGRMTASRSSRKWGWGSGIGGIGGGDGGDGAACHAYALHGPSQRSMGTFLQRLLCNGHGGCVKPGLVCGLESTAQASEHLNKDGRGTRGRSEQRVWPSCAGGVAVLENDVTADSTPEDRGLPVRCCWPHERTDGVKKNSPIGG